MPVLCCVLCSLFTNNCNHFSAALAELLCGGVVPQEILMQHEVLNRSPMVRR
jgi:hypothetical protein